MEQQEQQQQQPVVTSADESHQGDECPENRQESLSSSSDEDSEFNYGQNCVDDQVVTDGDSVLNHRSNKTTRDELYDENADDEDAAFVERNFRQHRSSVSTQKRQQDPSSLRKQGQQIMNTEKQEKNNKSPISPKGCNSDAILSCPCCFLTVCMDCQQHERYPNQYRAMFVMNIIVRWDLILTYDRKQKRLIPRQYNSSLHDKGDKSNDNNSALVVPLQEETKKSRSTKQLSSNEEIYYTVCCANCNTQVASLDMTDEVYHFYGCLASSS